MAYLPTVEIPRNAIFHGVPRGPQTARPRSICYICYSANPALFSIARLTLLTNKYLYLLWRHHR